MERKITNELIKWKIDSYKRPLLLSGISGCGKTHTVLIFGKDVPGYASLLVISLFMGSLQLIFIGIVGTYLGKTYIETKNRPIFIEKETKGFDEIL